MKQVMWVGALAVAVAAAFWLGRGARQPMYQVTVWGEVVVVCETRSGRCWVFSPMQRVWVALPPPVTD